MDFSENLADQQRIDKATYDAYNFISVQTKLYLGPFTQKKDSPEPSCLSFRKNHGWEEGGNEI
jgi:hypothetical protein